MEKRIQMLLGGRAAEIITYNDASSGAASDLKEASRLALTMVASLGLGDKGTLFSMDALAAFNIKPDTTLAVAEAEGVLVTQNERCFSVLHEYHEALRTVVASLLERETVPGSEVVQAVAAVRKNLEEGERRDPYSAMRASASAEEKKQDAKKNMHPDALLQVAMSEADSIIPAA